MRNLPRIGGGSMAPRAFARSLVDDILTAVNSGGGELTLPSGAIFDLSPRDGISVDQVGGLVISNAGSLVVEQDDLVPHNVIRFDGWGELQTTGTPITDFSAEVPFTFYFAYRVSELDSGAAGFLATLFNSTSNYSCVNFIGGDEVRVRNNTSGGAAVEDTSAADLVGQDIYAMAFTFYSLNEAQIVYDEIVNAVQSMSSTRDPGNFSKLIVGASASLGNELQGDLFRFVIYPGAFRSDVHAFMKSYSPLWNAGAELNNLTGTPVFGWSPYRTGGYTNARDGSGAKIKATIVNGYSSPGTTEGRPHTKPAGASDEMITYPYPGSATLSAADNDKLVVLLAFRGDTVGVQDLFSIGDDTSGGDRLYGSIDSASGRLTIGYKVSGTTVEEQLANAPVNTLCTAAFQFDYGASEGRLGIAVNGGPMAYFSDASLATLDPDLTKLIFFGQYSSQTVETFDGNLLALTVVEGQDYDTTMGEQFYTSTTGKVLLTSGLSYGGANADDLVGWWSAEQPLVSHEGNNGQTIVKGSPASELGTYGGRAYHQPASTANGYEIPITPVTLAADEALYSFVLFRNPSTGGSTSADTLAQIMGPLTSDRPTLVTRTNYSPKWAYGEIKNEVGIATIDQDTLTGWANDDVHVFMSRVTRSSDGLSYEVEVGINGTWTGSPGTRTSNDLGNYPFTRLSPGYPGFTSHHTGMQVFDVLAFHDTGTAINAASIASYLAGLVSP